jgi:hypothetical protein
VGFVVDIVAVEQVFCEYSDITCHFSLHVMLVFMIQAGAISPVVADEP